MTMKTKDSDPQQSKPVVQAEGNAAIDGESGRSSSDESLIEIRLNELIKRSEISDFDLRALVVRCSSCGTQINHFSDKECKRHRKLGVITCKDCYEFYGSSEFSQDESGYNYCTWCGNGGKLIVCDYCPNGFCSSCIRRNFGRAEISVTIKEGWKCYCCDNKRLKPKVKFCNLIIENKSKRIKKKEKISTNTNRSVSEDWLETAFSESDEACKNFHKKMAKLKSIGVNKSKSLRHIVKKMEEVINGHKTDLKNVVISLTKQYETYMQLQVQLNEKKSESDCIIIDGDSNKSPAVAETNKVPPDEINTTSATAEINKGSPGEELSDTSISVLTSHDSVNQLEEKKIKAKLSLLKSSSESEDSGKIEPSDECVLPDNDVQCNGNLSNQNLKDNDSDVSKIKNVDKKSSDPESHPVPNSDSKSKAKRKLTFDISDSSDSDFIIGKPNIEKLLDVIETPETEITDDNKGENTKEKENIVLDPEVDPKLTNLEPKVDLISCDHVFKDGETSIKLRDEVDMEDQLDRLVDSLCKFPLKKKNSKPKRKQKCGPLSSKRAAAKKELMESSSSISLSSDDEDKKKIELKSAENNSALSKEKPVSSDSSSDISSHDSEEEKKRSKKSKSSKKVENGDSSDDFVLPSKKKKYDKLLHGSLMSDDEKNRKENKEKRGPSKKRRLLSSDEEKGKKGRRRSDKSCSSTTSSDDEGVKKPKKRRRIKEIGSSSENEEDNSPGKGRKNIRKIVSQKKLAQSTKEAQLEEKERRKRISDRQRLYNKIEDMSIDGKEVITRKMVLEVDHDSKEEIVEINPDLVSKLKPHQVNGVKFMWECTIESVKDLDKPGSGCILAHCMGLGKTLQVIAFLHTCLTNRVINKKITKAMIICPYNTALNWASEFDFWLQDVEGDIKVHQLTSVKGNCERIDILKYWFVEGGVLIVSYDIFRRLSANKIAKLKAKDRNQIHHYILDPGPDIVVCDEGHILKNDKSAVSVATTKLNTKRRIVLTGTPLQNNLKEYHCMLSFVKPNLLGTSSEFRNRFVNPIINGQYDDSNDYDVKLMKKRIHILHKLLEGCVQRCDYSALTKFLPPKHEFVISVKLSEVQIQMYRCYLEKRTLAQQGAKVVGKSLFVDFNNLRCIWTHPYICHVSHERQEYKRLFKDESDEEFINDASESEKSTATPSSEDDILVEDSDNDKKKSYRTRSKAAEGDDDNESEEEETEEVKQWYHEFISEEDKYNLQLSGKIVLLMEILRECETIGDKIIVFSQSLLTLDCIENMLEYCSSQPVSEEDKKRDAIGTWIKGLDYFRMDGGTSVDFRKGFIDMFNNPTNDRSRLFLISTRAGSLGTNLIGANRVVLFDTSWNPSHDVQAIFRVYRFGQIKPVYVYRLLAQGTMEEKIYDRQVTKLSLSCRVVDEQQIDRHFSAADLAELYSFEPSPVPETTPMMPNDRLLAEMLIKQKDWIIKFHEHDSLLQHQTEEDLTEEERQAAWAEYENEREGRGPTPNTQGVNLEDFNLAQEPDFTSDYEGKYLPEIKGCYEFLYNRLKAKFPGKEHTVEFKEMVLAQVCSLRQLLQEKHVKVLRIKQECCTRGPVPNSVNKYLDELTIALKTTGDYAMTLSNHIQQLKVQQVRQQQLLQQRLQQQQQQQQQQQRQQQPIYNVHHLPRFSNATLQQARARFPNIRFVPAPAPGLAGQRFVFNSGRPVSNTYRNTSYTPSQQQTRNEPIITYTDDNAPAPEVVNLNPNPKQSTVIIEDIS